MSEHERATGSAPGGTEDPVGKGGLAKRRGLLAAVAGGTLVLGLIGFFSGRQLTYQIGASECLGNI